MLLTIKLSLLKLIKPVAPHFKTCFSGKSFNSLKAVGSESMYSLGEHLPLLKKANFAWPGQKKIRPITLIVWVLGRVGNMPKKG